jgi:hypothetical protein
MKTIWLTHDRISHSVVTAFCQVLVCFAFLFGPTAAKGQETPPLPDALQPTQSQSFESSIEQGMQRYEPSDNRIWVIPNNRLTVLTCPCFFKSGRPSRISNTGKD